MLGKVQHANKARAAIFTASSSSPRRPTMEGVEESRPSLTGRHVGWWVLLGSSVVIFTTTPFMSVFALLYKGKLDALEDEAVGTWAFLTYLTTWNIASLFSAPLVEVTSHRWSAACGILILSVGVALSAFASSAADLVLSAGLVAGLGTGLLTNPSVLIVTSHFGRGPRLGAAVGVLFTVMAGAAIVSALAVGRAGESFEDKTCTLAYAVFIAAGIVGTALFHPPPPAPPPDRREKTLEASLMPSPKWAAACGMDFARWEEKCFVWRFLMRIEWGLLKDLDFLVLAVGSAFSLACLLNFYYFLPLVADANLSRGGTIPVDSSSFAGLLSIVSTADLVSRFFFAWLGDWQFVKDSVAMPRKIIFSSCGLCLGIVIICVPYCYTYGQLSAASAVFGAFAGSVYTNAPLVYAESFPSSVDSALGLSCALRAAASLALAPAMQALADEGDGYASCLWLVGGITVALMLGWIVHETCRSSKKKS